MITKSVMDILLEQKIITDAQALEAKSSAEELGKSPEQILVEKGYITPEQLAKANASLYRLPYVEKVTDAMADLMVLAKMPLKFLRDNVVIPVMVDNQLPILPPTQ